MAVISSRCSAMNASHEATRPRAASSAAWLWPASSTSSLVTVSMVCSVERWKVTTHSRSFGLVARGLTAVVGERALGVLQLGLGGLVVGRLALLRRGGDGVGVERVDDGAGDLRQGGAAADGLELAGGAVVEQAVEAEQAAGERRERGRLAVAEGDGLEELLEGDAALALERARVDLVALGDADGVDDHEVRLAPGVRGDGLERGLVDDAHAAALHLLEEVARARPSA